MDVGVDVDEDVDMCVGVAVGVDVAARGGLKFKRGFGSCHGDGGGNESRGRCCGSNRTRGRVTKLGTRRRGDDDDCVAPVVAAAVASVGVVPEFDFVSRPDML